MQIFGAIVASVVLGFSSAGLSETDLDQSFLDLCQQFENEYRELNIPEFGLSYIENFKSIPSLQILQTQKQTFQSFEAKLSKIDRVNLSQDLRYQYDNFFYEIWSNLERIRLETNFKASSQEIPEGGLHRIPDRRSWYRFYAKRFASRDINIESLFLFGDSEVQRVKEEIKSIQARLGYAGRDAAFYHRLNDDSFFLRDEQEILDTYSAKQRIVLSGLKSIFHNIIVRPVTIEKIPNADADSPPGLYADDKFYFNFLGGRHNKRVMDWLYIHEAVPGHHYQQITSEVSQEPSVFTRLMWYPGFNEGWAAYIENFGKQVGLYKDLYSELGKWEWDLVRSVRVVLDVGIHYYGWSEAQAIDYWERNVPNNEAIMMREIRRVTNWPGQVLSYKTGERKIISLLEQSKKRLGEAFDIRDFHHAVLRRGAIPFPVLEEVIRDL